MIAPARAKPDDNPSILKIPYVAAQKGDGQARRQALSRHLKVEDGAMVEDTES
jgi:hypothetical protein